MDVEAMNVNIFLDKHYQHNSSNPHREPRILERYNCVSDWSQHEAFQKRFVLAQDRFFRRISNAIIWAN